MNKQRRKWLESVINKLEEQRDELANIQEEEQECYDNLPEGIQESDRGVQIQENADELDSASSDIDDIIERLYEIINQ